MPEVWKTIEKKLVFDHPRKKIENWKMLSHQGKELDFVIQVEQDVVIVVGVTADEEFLIIRQYYVNLEKTVASLVAGIVDEGCTPEKAAAKELWEEAGGVAGNIVYLGAVAKGKYTTGMIRYYLAQNLVLSGDQELEPAEDITIELVSRNVFIDMLKTNELAEGWVQLAGYKALEYLEAQEE
jgi:ADP-ribose pyrophosphatase